MNEHRRTYRAPDPARMAEFAATARRLQRERESAAEVVQRLLRDTPKNEWPWLARRPELHTSGALEELAKRVEAQLDREPREALVIAEVASVIADAIADDAYPAVVLAQMRAQAWKDRGQALDYLARYDEALAALDRAEEQLAAFGSLAHEMAIVRYVRAVALQHVNRFAESLELLHDCHQTFSDHGDARRRLISGIAHGMLLQRLHRYDEARELYVPLLVTAEELQDTSSLASLHNLFAHASLAKDDLAIADKHFSRAVQLFTQLEQPLQVLRAEDGQGRTMLARRDFTHATRHLTSVRRDFLAHGLIEEAGISGLGVVEALLGSGASDEAESMARQLVTEFTAAGLNERAITALAYLAETINARRASRDTVDTVREYIHSLRTHPEREFTITA